MTYDELYKKAKSMGFTGKNRSREDLEAFIKRKVEVNTLDIEPVEVKKTELKEEIKSIKMLNTSNRIIVVFGKKVLPSKEIVLSGEEYKSYKRLGLKDLR